MYVFKPVPMTAPMAQSPMPAPLPAPMPSNYGLPPGAPWSYQQGPHSVQSQSMVPAHSVPSPLFPHNSAAIQTVAKLQESDKLEKLSLGKEDMLQGTGAEAVRLVSLGGYCGPKLSFQEMGRGAETLPFDWLRSRIEGILHFLRSDFDGFFEWSSKAPAGPMTMYRSRYHSFWHDDPDDAGMHERYTRRIKRFGEIDAKSNPVLFVRAAVCTDEVMLAEELLAELQARFGPQARLLFLLDGRVTRRAVIAEKPDLLIYEIGDDVRSRGRAPFIQPVCDALDWVLGKPFPTEKFADVHEVARGMPKISLDTSHYHI
jgi:hypothetical protein